MTSNHADSFESTSVQGVTTQGTSFVATSVNHPRLVRTDAKLVRRFLRRHDQYSIEVSARAQQLILHGTTTTEAVRPVNLKYCVDSEYIESAVVLGFLEADSYDALTDQILRKNLEEKSEESPEAVTLEDLDSIMDKELRHQACNFAAPPRIRPGVCSP